MFLPVPGFASNREGLSFITQASRMDFGWWPGIPTEGPAWGGVGEGTVCLVPAILW